MRPRATADLAQLPDERLFEEVATGLVLTARWIEDLERWATQMVGVDAAGGEVIHLIADEEAAKFLILVDAIRCPRSRRKDLARQLRRCHQHLAKGIYGDICYYSAGSYEEMLSYIEPLRQSHYLDGPNDIEWMFRNEIEGRRERRLYVDYVETDDGRGWWEPNRYDHLTTMPSTESRVVQVVRSLIRAGIGSADAVATLAGVWRPFEPQGMSWSQLVERIADMMSRLDERGCVGEEFASRDRTILEDSWTFPLYRADLSMVDVDLDELRERQARWAPD